MNDTDFLKLCRSGNSKKVEQAIANGMDVNSKSYVGWMGLMSAVWSGYIEITRVLLKHIKNINIRNNYGYSALILRHSEATLKS